MKDEYKWTINWTNDADRVLLNHWRNIKQGSSSIEKVCSRFGVSESELQARYAFLLRKMQQAAVEQKGKAREFVDQENHAINGIEFLMTQACSSYKQQGDCLMHVAQALSAKVTAPQMLATLIGINGTDLADKDLLELFEMLLENFAVLEKPILNMVPVDEPNMEVHDNNDDDKA